MLQNKIEQQESIIHKLKSKQKENEEKITKKVLYYLHFI